MGISAFWFAANFHWTALLAILLPKQVAEMTGRYQSQCLGYLVGASALFPLVVPLIVGPLSDRCMSRFGRRRPYLYAGVTVNIIGLAMMLYYATASHVGPRVGALPFRFFGYAVGFIIVQIGNNIATGAYQGVIPDVVVPKQRGVASGYMGLMTQLGSALGIVAIALVFAGNTVVDYGLIVAILIICVVGTGIALKEKPLAIKPNALSLQSFFKSLWIDPKLYMDFWWVWITRALVMFGFYIVQPFVRYYLRDVIHVKNDSLDKTSGMIFLIILIGATITGLVGGWLSDRIGRKKIVYVANGMMAVAALVLVFCTTVNQALIVGVFFGLGYGAYISVDWALGTDVLPKQEDAATDMAIWHIAMVAPQSIAGPLAGFLLGVFGTTMEKYKGEEVTHYAQSAYLLTFGIAAIALALGAVLLRNVRKAT